MSSLRMELENARLFSTPFIPPEIERLEQMTIGIGALCDSGGCVILGCDTRGSYDARHCLNPNDSTSKSYTLPHECFVLVSGVLHETHEVVSHLTVEFGKLSETFEVDQAREAINEGRFYEYRQKAGDRIFAKFGLPLSEWWKLSHDAHVYQGGTNIFKNIPIPVSIIVAGFRSNNPERNTPGSTAAILFRAIGKHPVETENNYTVIGSGSNEARRVLDRRGQNLHRSWQRTAIDVIAAMRAARRGNKRSVGNSDDLIVIFQTQIKRLPVGATFVRTMLEKTKDAKISHLNQFDDRTNEILRTLLYDQPPEA